MNKWVALIFVLLLAGCSVGAPDYSGQWVGSVFDSVGGAGTGNITIAQSGSQITGSWQIGFGSLVNSGSLQGVVSGNSISAQLYPSRADACPYTLTATRSGNTLNGNYSAFSCTISISGTFTGTRQ